MHNKGLLHVHKFNSNCKYLYSLIVEGVDRHNYIKILIFTVYIMYLKKGRDRNPIAIKW